MKLEITRGTTISFILIIQNDDGTKQKTEKKMVT